MTYDAGDIVLLPFPFTDLSTAKRRPVLVLSRASFNTQSPDFVVCAITSNLSNTANSVLIDGKDMARGRLPTTSRIKVAKLATLSQSLVLKAVGRITPVVLQRVRKELLTIL